MQALWVGLFTTTLFLSSATNAFPTNATATGVASRPTGLPGHPGKCTEENMIVRREWSTLTAEERIDFTDSVKCLMDKPARTPKEAAPAAISRYHDFTTSHVNNTLLIHANGVFLSWHRHMIHLFERALKEECGYKGSLPYWNWPWWSDNLGASPLFDGSKTSLGGDGYYNGSQALALKNGNYTFPRGNGGGCITKGPFANITIPFREFNPSDILLLDPPEDALVYAPHCLRRDLNNAISGTNLNQDRVNRLLSAPTITEFQDVIDNRVPNSPITSTHNGGHFALGRDMADQYASPSDPAFYLHHAMIDNMWAQWQAKDPKNRQYALEGTNRTLNLPPSTPVTVDYETKFDYLDEPHKLGELMNTQAGMYCYRYEYEEGALKPY